MSTPREPKAPTFIELDGLSSTGTRHGLRIALAKGDDLKVAITGHTGKQHAAVLLDPAAEADLLQFLLDRQAQASA